MFKAVGVALPPLVSQLPPPAIGQPISRADGRLKVTGGARYSGDIHLPGAVHGAIVHTTIANGRTVSIDTTAAEKAPGVLAVFTHHNMPRMNPTPRPWSHLHPHGQGYLPLQDDKIHYAGQPIALVVATMLDQAMHAGTLITVEYEASRRVVFNSESAKGGSILRSCCGLSLPRSATRTRQSQPVPSRSSRLTPRPIAITTRWNRT